LYQNMKRYIKIGKSYGKPFDSANGLGQGDSYSLMVALTMVSIQLDFISDKFPNVKMGSAVDDRNIRGSMEDVCDAYKAMADFDKATGHFNNPKKLAMTSTCPKERIKLAKFTVGIDEQNMHIHPRIFKTETLVGDYINVSRAPARQQSEKRVEYTVQTAQRVVKCPSGDALRARAVATLVIPRLPQGTQWTFPTSKSFARLRYIILAAIWSTERRMRCTEIVIAVLSDPTKVDPWAATIVRVILNVKRIISKSVDRQVQFIQCLKWAMDARHTNIQGPAHAFIRMIRLLGLDLDLNRVSDQGNHATIWISDEFFARIDILGDSKSVIKSKLRTWCRRAILETLQDRCVPKVDEDGIIDPHFNPNKARKDMISISKYVDMGATLENFGQKKGSHQYAKDPELANTLKSVIAGSIRCGDRLNAADIIESDICSHPECNGQRHTTRHVFRECLRHSKRRKQCEEQVDKILQHANQQHGHIAVANLKEVLADKTFQVTGICPDDMMAIAMDTRKRDVEKVKECKPELFQMIDDLSDNLTYELEDGIGTQQLIRMDHF